MPKSDGWIKKGEVRNPKGRGQDSKGIWNLVQACKNEGYDPILALVKFAKYGSTEEIQLKANFKIVERLIPVLKSVEHKGEIDSKFSLNVYFSGEKPKINDNP